MKSMIPSQIRRGLRIFASVLSNVLLELQGGSGQISLVPSYLLPGLQMLLSSFPACESSSL